MRAFVLPVLAALTITAAGVGVGWSAPPRQAAAATGGRHEVHRSMYLKFGPSQQCDGDSCGVGLAQARLSLPDPGPYKVIITETFQYRTTGKAKFGTSIGVAHGNRPSTTPVRWALAGTADTTSTTVTYRAYLSNDRHYVLSPHALGTHATTNSWSITMSHVLISVDATPVRPRAIR
jgi:hypothetical protein